MTSSTTTANNNNSGGSFLSSIFGSPSSTTTSPTPQAFKLHLPFEEISSIIRTKDVESIEAVKIHQFSILVPEAIRITTKNNREVPVLFVATNVFLVFF